MTLESRVAVITGAGSGIGRAIALRFAADEVRIVVADINQDGGSETVALIRASGGRADMIGVDVSRSDSVANLFSDLDGRALVPDILVNNAGVATPFSPMHEVSDSDWDRVVRTHLCGSFYCTREALRRMLTRGQGIIINLGSVSGLRGLPGTVAYSASKGAIIAMTKTVALEVARNGIRVNCIAPGWVETPMLNDMPDARRAQLPSMIPLGRIGTPEEIAAVAAFLASEDASYVTGQVISPNGGLYI